VGLVVGVVGWPNGTVAAAGHCGRADGRGVRQVARGGGAAHRLHVVAAFVESIARGRRAEDRARRARRLLRRLRLRRRARRAMAGDTDPLPLACPFPLAPCRVPAGRFCSPSPLVAAWLNSFNSSIASFD
jgi:hypothetical protein